MGYFRFNVHLFVATKREEGKVVRKQRRCKFADGETKLAGLEKTRRF